MPGEILQFTEADLYVEILNKGSVDKISSGELSSVVYINY